MSRFGSNVTPRPDSKVRVSIPVLFRSVLAEAAQKVRELKPGSRVTARKALGAQK
jgi:DNA-binding transcriptional regulator/RsmH inhibitor MraZ